jgi:diguanylate cyclase (GGDEF)-like protein/PAS domain S-box-containing protein
MDVILGRPRKPQPQLGRNPITDDVTEHAQLTLDSIANAVLSSDKAGNVMYLNSAAEAMTGWSRSEAKGRPLGEVLQIVDGSTREPLVRDLVRLAIERDERVALAANSVLVRRDGLEFPIEDSVAPIHGRDGHVIGAVIVFHDASEVRATALRMSHLACHDFLTDLPNPVLLGDRITQAIALAHRHDKQLAVLFIDLDGFKLVNDLLGHAVGDELLRSVARRLKGSVRDSDTVSRHGGDEFVVLLSAIEHAEHAAISADKIIAAVAAPHEIFGRKLRVTASIGIAVYPTDGASTNALLKSADLAMYQAKDAGGNGYRFSTQAVPTVRAARLRVRLGWVLGLARLG